MELLTPRFLKTAGVFTGLHTLIWLGVQYLFLHWLGEDRNTDLIVGLLIITGVPIAMMYAAQLTRRITGSTWIECLSALLVAGPVAFAIGWQYYYFLGIEGTIYIAALNLMGLFLLPLWEPQTRTEFDGALAISERSAFLFGVLPPLAVAVYGFFFHPYDPDFLFIVFQLVTGAFFFGMIASVALAYGKRLRESATIGAAVTLTFIVGYCVCFLQLMNLYAAYAASSEFTSPLAILVRYFMHR